MDSRKVIEDLWPKADWETEQTERLQDLKTAAESKQQMAWLGHGFQTDDGEGQVGH